MIELERKELLRRFAYVHWVERGCLATSRDADWEYANEMLEEFKWESMRILDAALLEIKCEQTGDWRAVRNAKMLPMNRTLSAIK